MTRDEQSQADEQARNLTAAINAKTAELNENMTYRFWLLMLVFVLFVGILFTFF